MLTNETVIIAQVGTVSGIISNAAGVLRQHLALEGEGAKLEPGGMLAN